MLFKQQLKSLLAGNKKPSTDDHPHDHHFDTPLVPLHFSKEDDDFDKLVAFTPLSDEESGDTDEEDERERRLSSSGPADMLEFQKQRRTARVESSSGPAYF